MTLKDVDNRDLWSVDIVPRPDARPGDPFSGLFSARVTCCRENPGVLTFAMLCPVTEMACWVVNRADFPISTSLLIDIYPSTNLKKTNQSFWFRVSGFGFRVVRIRFRILETRNPKLVTLKRNTIHAFR